MPAALRVPPAGLVRRRTAFFEGETQMAKKAEDRGLASPKRVSCAPQSYHGCRLKALLCAGADSWPAARAMFLRLYAPLLVCVPRNDGRVDRFNDFAAPFDSCFAMKSLPKSRPSSAKS